MDPTDSPEKPWWRAPGRKLVVYFENRGVSDRYWRMVDTAAALWSRSPCVQVKAVDTAPPSRNRVAVRQKRVSMLQLDTDGELHDRGQYRTGGTLTLYTWHLDRASDKGALATVVHEMGHALGLVHRTDENDVMHAETDDETNPVPDAIDFRNLRVLYGARPFSEGFGGDPGGASYGRR